MLTRYYSSQGLEIDDVFKFKTAAERAAFKNTNDQKKLITCKRLLNLQ